MWLLTQLFCRPTHFNPVSQTQIPRGPQRDPRALAIVRRIQDKTPGAQFGPRNLGLDRASLLELKLNGHKVGFGQLSEEGVPFQRGVFSLFFWAGGDTIPNKSGVNSPCSVVRFQLQHGGCKWHPANARVQRPMLRPMF